MKPSGANVRGLLRLVLDELRDDSAARTELEDLLGVDPARDRHPRAAYTVDTLAAELDVSARAVRAWIASGELAAVKRAGRWVIAAATVEAWASPDSPSAARPRAVRRRPSPTRSPLRDALNAMKDAA